MTESYGTDGADASACEWCDASQSRVEFLARQCAELQAELEARYAEWEHTASELGTPFDPGPNTVADQGDTAPDGWEIDHGFDPADGADGFTDPDGDGLDNGGESAAGSEPRVADWK